MLLFNVVVKVALSCELSGASLLLAQIRPLTSVQTHVRFKVSLLVESFAASFDRTYKVATSLVLFKMNLQSLGSTVRLSTSLIGTLVVFELFVGFDVVF